MPTTLNIIPFEPDLLPLVRGFDCTVGTSTEFWEREINEWITLEAASGDGALFWMGKGTQVWLYTNEDDDVVGYGSLCRSNWPDPAAVQWHKKLERKPISLIPAVGIDQRFQGGPPGAERAERYSTKILGHLIHQARQHADRLSFLGLFVHPQNARAIKFYFANGFTYLAGYTAKNKGAGVDYPAMVLGLG